MTRRTPLLVLFGFVVFIGSAGCGADPPPGGGAAGGGGIVTSDAGAPSRGPTVDAGGAVVVVVVDGGGGGVVMCPDGVRGNDIPCDSTVDVICLSDCMNDSRIRCGCTTRGGQGDRWVCGGQPQPCQ